MAEMEFGIGIGFGVRLDLLLLTWIEWIRSSSQS